MVDIVNSKPIVRGDTFQEIVTLKRKDNAGVYQPINLSDPNTRIRSTFLLNPFDAPIDALAMIELSAGIEFVTDGTDGQIEQTLEALETLDAPAPCIVYWDIKVHEADGIESTTTIGTLPIYLGSSQAVLG